MSRPISSMAQKMPKDLSTSNIQKDISADSSLIEGEYEAVYLNSKLSHNTSKIYPTLPEKISTDAPEEASKKAIISDYFREENLQINPKNTTDNISKEAQIAQNISLPDINYPPPKDLNNSPKIPQPRSATELNNQPSQEDLLDSEPNPDKVYTIVGIAARPKSSSNANKIYDQNLLDSIFKKIVLNIKENKVQSVTICNKSNIISIPNCSNTSNVNLLNLNSFLNGQALSVSFTQIFQMTTGISELYSELGYKTSGATIQIKPNSLIFEIVEGYIDPYHLNISIKPSQPSTNLSPRYIREQLSGQISRPINTDNLQNSLQLLKIDPLVGSVTAKLSVGSNPADGILDVLVEEAKFSRVGIEFSNSRSPLIGEIERKATLRFPNFPGAGGQALFSYANTEGSNALDFLYEIPITPQRDTIRFAFGTGVSEVIEEPFRDIDRDGRGGDIKTRTTSGEISFRHPITRHVYPSGFNNLTFEEFAIGVTGSWRESHTSLLGIPFPLSVGADSNGSTRIAALRFFQDYSMRESDGRAIAFRSQLNFGLGIFGSSTAEGSAPDSRSPIQN